MARLSQKRCVITGAGSGIGAATARRFAEEGARVVCVDIDPSSAQEVADEINAAYPMAAVALEADVSSMEDVKRTVFVCVSEFGGIDVYFANAGVLGRFVPIAAESEKSFQHTMGVNTLGPFMAIKYAAVEMARNPGGGSIICTASIAAIRADLTPLQYAASKGALLSMVIAANDRLLLDGVRVNAVVPGGVLTPIVMGVAEDLDKQGLYLKGFDFKRYSFAKPEQIANIVLFLASDESSAIKGQAIVADGGMSNSMGSQPLPQKKKKRSGHNTYRSKL